MTGKKATAPSLDNNARRKNKELSMALFPADEFEIYNCLQHKRKNNNENSSSRLFMFATTSVWIG